MNLREQELPEISKEESEIIELVKKHGKIIKNFMNEDIIIYTFEDSADIFIHDEDYECDLPIEELNVYHGRLGLSSGQEVDGYWEEFEDQDREQLYPKIIEYFKTKNGN